MQDESSIPQFGDERLPSRFWEKLGVNPETDCWEWMAYRRAA